MESISQDQQRYLMPTYLASLNLAVQAAISRLSEGSIVGSWMCLQTLFIISPQVVQKDMKADYEAILRKLKFAMYRNINPDSLIQQTNQAADSSEVLRRENPVFFQKLVSSLDRHGYLEKNPKTVPIGHE